MIEFKDLNDLIMSDVRHVGEIINHPFIFHSAVHALTYNQFTITQYPACTSLDCGRGPSLTGGEHPHRARAGCRICQDGPGATTAPALLVE